MNQPKVSICILSFNRMALLYHSLQRLKNDLKYQKSQIEILVIDNGSSDATVSMLHTFFPEIRLFPLSQNNGITSWNTLIEEAKGDYILLLDDDAYIMHDNLSLAVEALEKDEKAAALAIRAINPEGRIDFNHAYPTGVLSYWGCSALFKANILKDLKGYDSSFFFQAFELDLSIRLKESGYHILYLPNVWAVHLTEPNYNPNGFKFYVSRRNLLYVVQKHFNGFLKLKLLLRLSIMTLIQGRVFNLKTPLKAILHGILKGRSLTRKPVSKVLQRLYEKDFSEFQSVRVQRRMWKNRDFWLKKPHSYPHLQAPFPDLGSKTNQLLIFVHRLNIDGATQMVLKALSSKTFFNSFGSVTLISTMDGVMKSTFETLGATVRIIPYAEHLNPNNSYYNAIKKELDFYIKKAGSIWINTLDHSYEFFKMIHESETSTFIFGHESLKPDSPVMSDLHINENKRQVLSSLTLRSNVTFGFPSISTQASANTFLGTPHVKLIHYGIKMQSEPTMARYTNVSKIRFLVTGWLCYRKNQNMLIDVFEEVQKQISESKAKFRKFELNFVGTPYSHPTYRDLITRAIKALGASSVNFYPMIPNAEILSLMKDTHIVLIPSLGEALCVSALEMMNTGGIVVSSDCEGSDDIFENGMNGFVLPRNAYGKWVELVLRLLDPSDFREEQFRKIGQNAWKSCKKFDMKQYEQNLLAILDRTPPSRSSQELRGRYEIGSIGILQ